MKILVCVKQVPASDSRVTVRRGRLHVDERGPSPRAMNRFDEYAVEAAVALKEKTPGTEVDVVSAGPERVLETIKRAVGMGADRGIHIPAEQSEIDDPMAAAALLAAAVRGRRYDLILAGLMSSDGCHGVTGPAVAEMLGIPSVTFAADIRIEGGAARIERELTGSAREIVVAALPLLVTVQAGINRPRYPSLSNMLRAEKNAIETIDPPVPGGTQAGKYTTIHGFDYPGKKRGALFIEGSTLQKAQRLRELLAEKHLLECAND